MELYVHIPFCVRKCRYCDFASYAGEEGRMAAYIGLVLREARQRGGNHLHAAGSRLRCGAADILIILGESSCSND